jgi:hypothetical protein
VTHGRRARCLAERVGHRPRGGSGERLAGHRPFSGQGRNRQELQKVPQRLDGLHEQVVVERIRREDSSPRQDEPPGCYTEGAREPVPADGGVRASRS